MMLLLFGIGNSPLERGGPCRNRLGLMKPKQPPNPFSATMVAGRGVEMPVGGKKTNNHHSGN